MSEPSRIHLVADSLAALRREVPDAHRRLGDALGVKIVRFHIGADVFAIRRLGRDVLVEQSAGAPNVEVETSWTTVIDIVEGRCSLLDSLLERRVAAKGPPDDIASLHQALREYVRGAVRGGSFPDLWRELKRSAEPRREVAHEGVSLQ
jgi:hypothetical protein